MFKHTAAQFRAKLLSVEGNFALVTVLDGDAGKVKELVFSHSGQLRRVVGLPIGDATIEFELDFPIDAQAGEIIASATHRPEYADQFEAEIHWLAEQPMLPGRRYTLVCAGQSVAATITKLKYKVETVSGSQLAANTVAKDETFVGNLSLNQNIAFDPAVSSLQTSQFELLDSEGETLANGQIQHSLRRASNLHWQALEVDRTARSQLKNQTPKIIWLTGLSGSGKSTIANVIEKKLLAQGKHTYLLDGDNVRQGINKDLGFTDEDRVENIRRISEISKLMLDAGLIVITSFISPFRAERRMARSLFADKEFIEVHVDASLAVCEQRDPKGLYKKARQGGIKNFTGLDSPYEIPQNPELRIDTVAVSAEDAATAIMAWLFKQDIS
ncbi:MAG: bifunctional enzyme CysN/CysC [Pseudohongiellaceae bacterium]|jgi:bifunctional enzyme CysN/CysC